MQQRMPQRLALHLEVTVGNLGIDIIGMVEGKRPQRRIGIEVGKGVEPGFGRLAIGCVPLLQTDSHTRIAQRKEIQQHTRETEPLVQGTHVA